MSYFSPITRLYDSAGNEWHGSFTELTKACETYTQRVFECKSEKWVTTPSGGEELAREQGELIKEIHYRSEYERGMALPYVLVTYVWQNGKQIFPTVGDSSDN